MYNVLLSVGVSVQVARYDMGYLQRDVGDKGSHLLGLPLEERDAGAAVAGPAVNNGARESAVQ